MRAGYVHRRGNEWALTGQGSMASGDWQRDPERPAARLVPVAVHMIGGVTGITEAELGMGTRVEFTWTWRLTPVGDDVRRAGALQQYGAGQHQGQALFKYYDDGWRVEQLEL